MKKFNLKLITPLILTLVLQGCMPDSLTKFKKDQPKRAPAPVTPQVIDATGKTLSLIPPTKFYYSDVTTNTYNATLDLALSQAPVIDGSLGDSSVRASFLKSCKLDLSGNAQTQALPPGLSLSAADCIISGTPTAITTVTTEFCSPANIATQGACEATPLVWDSTAGTCSNPDYQYATQAACISGNNKWHKLGTPLPYRIVITYQTEFFEPKTISTTINLGVYEKPILLGYNQHDRLVFKVDTTGSLATNIETTDYNRYGLLTSSKDITGVVKFFDASTNLVGVVRVSPLTLSSVTGFAVNDFIYGANGAIGKIQKITGTTVYVERLTSALNFSAGQNVRYGAKAAYPQTYAAASGGTTIASIDDAYVFDASVTALDNDDQYYSDDYAQSAITRVYEKGITIDNIIPTATSQINPLNGINYSITPALPLGLSFDTATGIISGMFTNTLISTKFTITASNPLGSIAYSIYLSAIEAPKDLSYTTRQLITVTSNAAFLEGEGLFQQLAPPLTESTMGKVLRKYSTNLMSIATSNGQFLEGVAIDSGNAFYNLKAAVLANPISYNTALTVSDISVATVGDYVSSSTNALGRVVAVDTASLTLFIQYLNSSATPNLFQQDDKISNGLTYAASTVNIDQVEADNMKLTISAVPAALKTGDELTVALAATPTVGDLGAYIHKISGSTIYVNDVSRKDSQPFYFRKTQVFDNNEKMTVNRGSLTAVAHDNFIVVERGAKVEIKSNLSQGNGVLFTVSPSLPVGLALSSSTGMISGTPTFAVTRTTYTISAKNLANESKFIFDLESRDYFKIGEKMGASSALFHKRGDSRGSRKCQINATDITNFASVNDETRDVRCFLDVEEEDLHSKKLALVSSIGPSACEYVQIYPYSFWSHPPVQSAPTTEYRTGCTPAAPADVAVSTTAPTALNACAGNYTANGGPNCDESVITVTQHAWSGGCVTDTQSTSTISCGGKISNCLKGPVRDILSDTLIVGGARTLLYSSASGAVLDSLFTAPADNLDKSNLRAANGSIGNKCTGANSDSDLWSLSRSTTLSTNNPFGQGSNPFYAINCLDAAKNVKARIRVVVREWNNTFKLKDSIDLDFIVPAEAAIAPSLMNNNVFVFGKNNNDYADWDDFYAGTGAADFSNVTCGQGTCSNVLYTDVKSCQEAGGTWTITAPTREYQFPEENL